MDKLILTWNPMDSYKDIVDVRILKEGERGYRSTNWKMTKEEIIEKNTLQGITEKDRIIAEARHSA